MAYLLSIYSIPHVTRGAPSVCGECDAFAWAFQPDVTKCA